MLVLKRSAESGKNFPLDLDVGQHYSLCFSANLSLKRMNYLDATQEAGIDFYQKYHQKGKIHMLNLLKFRKNVDSAILSNVDNDLSGEEVYNQYLNLMDTMFRKAGSKILYKGKGNSFLIGPESEKWDLILLVEHQTVSRFIALAQTEDYKAIEKYRHASLEDSRLLP